MKLPLSLLLKKELKIANVSIELMQNYINKNYSSDNPKTREQVRLNRLKLERHEVVRDLITYVLDRSLPEPAYRFEFNHDQFQAILDDKYTVAAINNVCRKCGYPTFKHYPTKELLCIGCDHKEKLPVTSEK